MILVEMYPSQPLMRVKSSVPLHLPAGSNARALKGSVSMVREEFCGVMDSKK